LINSCRNVSAALSPPNKVKLHLFHDKLKPLSSAWYLVSDLSHYSTAYSAARKYVDQNWKDINRSQTHECGNCSEAAQFLFWKYINGILVAVCIHNDDVTFYIHRKFNTENVPVRLKTWLFRYLFSVHFLIWHSVPEPEF
jgi:hypothetical protein